MPLNRNKKKNAAKRRKQRRRRMLLFLLIVLCAVGCALFVFSRKSFHSRTKLPTVRVTESSAGNNYSGTLVIARNEKVYEAESNTTVDFVAAEGSSIRRLDTICRIYSSGYNQTEVARLQQYRDEIQQYHVNQVFSSYVDAALDSENREISSLAGQVAVMVHSSGTGSLSRLETQLNNSLSARKSYLKQKYPDDQTLNELYKIENDQLKKIESWTMTETAKEDCIVSFYTDGFETSVNANTYLSMEPEEIRQVIRGIRPERSTVSRGSVPIYRTIQDDEWFALFLCRDQDWKPVRGQTFQIRIQGFEGEPISAILENSTRMGSDLLLRMRVTEKGSVQSVLNMRTCNATILNYEYGFYVPPAAIYTYQGMEGVVVDDGATGMFIEVVRIGTSDSQGYLIRPTDANAPLHAGSRVFLFGNLE